MALQNKELKILIGCTGSVATIKLPKLIQGILNIGPNIKVRQPGVAMTSKYNKKCNLVSGSNSCD